MMKEASFFPEEKDTLNSLGVIPEGSGQVATHSEGTLQFSIPLTGSKHVLHCEGPPQLLSTLGDKGIQGVSAFFKMVEVL